MQPAVSVDAQHGNYPTRFSHRPSLYRDRHPRAPFLTLPFRPADFTGVTFADAAD